jgi:hypothetical protein
MAKSKEDEQEERMLANSYLNIASAYAWKDLMKLVDSIQENANHILDERDSDDISLVDIGIVKGLRESTRKIKKHIDFYLNLDERRG